MKQDEIKKLIDKNSQKIDEINYKLKLLNMFETSYIINLLLSSIPAGLSMILIFILSNVVSVGSEVLAFIPITTFGISSAVISKIIKNMLNKKIKLFSNSKNSSERIEEMVNYEIEKYKLIGKNKFLKKINKNKHFLGNNIITKELNKIDLPIIEGLYDKLNEEVKKYEKQSAVSLKQNVLINSFSDIRDKRIKIVTYWLLGAMLWMMLS